MVYLFDSFSGTTFEQKWVSMRNAVIGNNEQDEVQFTSGQTYNIVSMVHLNDVNDLILTSTGIIKARLISNQNNIISQPDGVPHNVNNLTVRNLHFESTATSTGQGSPNALINISFGSGANHLFEDNYFTAPNAVTNGIKYYTTNSSLYENITVRRNVFENLGRMGFETINHVDNSLEQIRVRNILTEDNIFRNTGLVRYGMGVSYSGRNDNVVTRFNTFHNNPTTAMELIGVEVGEIYGNIATGTGSPWHTVRLNVSSATRPNNNITIRDNYFDTTLGPWVIGATNLVSRNNYYRVQGNIFAQNYTNVRWENDTFEVRGFNPFFNGGTPTAFIQMQNNVTGLTNDITPSSNMNFINSRMQLTNNVPVFQIGDGVTPNVTRSEVYLPNAASQYSGANNVDVSLFVNGVFNTELGNTGANYGVVGYINTGNYGVRNTDIMLEVVGNIIFTDIQKQLFTAAFANPNGTFPGNRTGYSNDTADIDLRAEQFRSDMSTNGIDRGAFVGFNDGVNLIPNVNQNGGQPFPPSWTSNGYGPLFSNRNIHSAALKAFANDDVTLAGYVLTGLLQRANDLNLDFSNGGSRRVAGEPTKTNATYGTVERFPFERQDNFDAIAKNNPWFMLSSKMEQYLISYLIIYPLIQNSTLYTNNANTLNYWFNDYYRFIKFSADLNTSYWLGSNWRNFQRDWARPTLVTSAGVAYNADGTRLYSTSDGVIQSFNNRAMDSYSYIALFGKAFENTEALDFTYDLFRGYLATAVLGDGTFMEHYRWDANPDYIFTNVVKWFLIAHTNEVAVEKGLAPVTDKGKYYDHIETLSSDDLYNGATFSSTNGQPKTLRLILENLSRYYRNTSTGGYQGARNRATVSSGNITSSNTPYTTNHVQNLMQAIYLSYNPNDQAIRDFKNYASSAGYLASLNGSMQANGDGPHSLGTAWGLGNALGGHIAFGETNAFSGTVNLPPTNTSVTRAKIFRQFFYY